MEQTCTLFVNHLDIHVSRTINDSHNIPICLHIVYHESFEIWFGKFMFDHCVVWLCSHNLLHFNVFKLHVANYNGHDFVIGQIIYLASYCCLVGNTFNTIKHYPKNF
jgi:hypothetical protein